jgi:hypothetical protein
MKTGQVFVSHTAEMAEFPEDWSFVQAALHAVGRAKMAPVEMSYFAAQEVSPAEYCAQRVRECEVYVAIVGFRYGSVTDEKGVSYTELEFTAAGEAGLPRLVFLLESDAAVPARLIDPDRGTVEEFRGRLRGAGLVIRYFTSADRLELEVFHALAELTRGAGDDGVGAGKPERSTEAGTAPAALPADAAAAVASVPDPEPRPAPRNGAPDRPRRRGRRSYWRAAVIPGVVVCGLLAGAAIYHGRAWGPTSVRPPATARSRAVPAPSAGTAGPAPAALTGPPEFSHSTIAAGLHANGAADTFGLDPQGQVIHSEMAGATGDWGLWTAFGPHGTGVAVAVAPDSSHLLHVMVVMADGSIQERSEVALNQWGNWQVFAPAGTARVLGLGQDRDGYLEAFAVTPGGHLISRRELNPGGSTWSGWEPADLPGTVRSVAVTQKIDGYLDVMAVMADGSVEWEDEDRTGWRPWILFGPAGTASEVTIGENADSTGVVFALTPGGTVAVRYQENASGRPWGAWEPAFGPSCTATSVNVAAQDHQRLAVLAHCADGSVHDVFEPAPDAPWIGGWKVFGPPGGFGVDPPVA